MSITEEIQTAAMSKKNIDAVYKIELESFSSPWSKRSFYEELSNDLAHYEVLTYNDEPVAYAGMWIMFDEAHITKIAVMPSMRKKGLGKEMMQHMIRVAKAHGVTMMTLEVRQHNTTAQCLYNSLGFSIKGIRKKYYTDTGEDGLIMWADI